MNRTLTCLLSVTTALLITAPAARGADIVDTAVSAGSFKTLTAAVEAAGLVDALKGKGPFTVFAPTDEAFSRLPAGTIESLLKPENKDQLVAILTYHVVPGQVPASDVARLSGAKTLNGQRVDIEAADGQVRVDSANVLKTDVACTNGIIHVIDRVILPSSDNLAVTAEGAESFKTLLAAATAAGLVPALTGDQQLTVFAPTDEAFSKLPKGMVESLLQPENKRKLASILKYHVVAGRVYSEDAVAAERAETLQGGSLRISVTQGQATVNSANLVATDIDASNGVIHVIDSVLLPPEKKQISAAKTRTMIEHAVARGSRLYNSGHHSACAKIYMTTMSELARSDQMPEDVRASVQHVMTKVRHTTCPTALSWELRRGLDRVYARMAASK